MSEEPIQELLLKDFLSCTRRTSGLPGAFAEVIYAPKGDMSKWYLTGLYNWVDSDYNELDYSSATLHAGYLLRRNMRVVGEFTQHDESGILW